MKKYLLFLSFLTSFPLLINTVQAQTATCSAKTAVYGQYVSLWTDSPLVTLGGAASSTMNIGVTNSPSANSVNIGGTGSNTTIRGITAVTASASNPDFMVGGTNLNTYGWEDINVDLVSKGSTNAAAYTLITNTIFYAYVFSSLTISQYTGNQDKNVYANIHIPHRYAAGTGVYLHVHFIPLAAPPTPCNLGFRFLTAYADRTSGSTTGSFPLGAYSTSYAYATVPSTSYTASPSVIAQHFVAETSVPIVTSAPSTTSVKVDGIIMAFLGRTGTDDTTNVPAPTCSISAGVLFLDAHIQVNKWGTKSKDDPYYT